jgi:hypothetical protein
VLERVAKRGAHVVVLRFDPVEPDRRAPGPQLGLRELRELEEELAVLAPQFVSLSGVLESLERELADRLQHPEAAVPEPDEALVDERLEHVQIGAADGLRCFESAAAGEHGQAGEESLLLFGQELVAPGDGRPQRLLACLGVAAAPEQIEPLGEPLQDLGRGEHARPRRGQLDRERQVVQAAAQLGDVVARLQL